jgi:hypothetical protein
MCPMPNTVGTTPYRATLITDKEMKLANAARISPWPRILQST